MAQSRPPSYSGSPPLTTSGLSRAFASVRPVLIRRTSIAALIWGQIPCGCCIAGRPKACSSRGSIAFFKFGQTGGQGAERRLEFWFRAPPWPARWRSEILPKGNLSRHAVQTHAALFATAGLAAALHQCARLSSKGWWESAQITTALVNYRTEEVS